MRISRRGALRLGLLGAALAAAQGCVPPVPPPPAPPPSLLGPLGNPDALGIRLPSGFRSRLLARSNEAVAGTSYTWHYAPDGGRTFATADGGWVYVSNAELPAPLGGVGMLRFDSTGRVIDARRLLDGTTANCSGGDTPWGTWLSCEEHPTGLVWEVDPLGLTPPRSLPGLGRFPHEGAAVNAARRTIYLTEDAPDGLLYRFRYTTAGDPTSGVLQAAAAGAGGVVTWSTVPDPSAATTPTRRQVPGATTFNGGEGIWYAEGVVNFTTKGDNKVWAMDVRTGVLSVVYDPATAANPILTGVDNLARSPRGDLLVCEDGGDMQLVAIEPNGRVSPVLQIVGQATSELTGVALSPSGRHLYLASQRGPDLRGLVYEITGPWPW